MNEVTPTATYKEEVAQYTKKDALHALLFVAYLALLLTAFNVLANAVNLDGLAWQLSFVGMGLFLVILPTFVIVKKKGQKFGSLGFHLLGWKRALGAGLLIAAVILMVLNGILPGLLAGWQMHTGMMLIWIIVYWLIRVFMEDIAIIGYLQTRIYGLVKNDVLAVLVVAFIFAALHYPTTFLTSDGFGPAFWGTLIILTFAWMLAHIMMNMFFRWYRSIIPVTLYHLAWNLSNGGQLWADRGDEGLDFVISSLIVIFAALSICLFLPSLKKFLKKRDTAK